MTSGKQTTSIPLPARGVVKVDKTAVLEARDSDKHFLAAAGAWLQRGRQIKATGLIEDCIVKKRDGTEVAMKAVEFEVPNTRKTGEFEYFYVVMDDVDLTPFTPTTH